MHTLVKTLAVAAALWIGAQPPHFRGSIGSCFSRRPRKRPPTSTSAMSTAMAASTSCWPRGATGAWSIAFFSAMAAAVSVRVRPWPASDKTYSGNLVDLDGDGDLDVVISNDTPIPNASTSTTVKAFSEAGTTGARLVDSKCGGR